MCKFNKKTEGIIARPKGSSHLVKHDIIYNNAQIELVGSVIIIGVHFLDHYYGTTTPTLQSKNLVTQ